MAYLLGMIANSWSRLVKSIFKINLELAYQLCHYWNQYILQDVNIVEFLAL